MSASLGFFQANVAKAKQGRRVHDTVEKVALRTAQEEGEAVVSVGWPFYQERLFPLCILTRQAHVPN